LLDKWFAVLHTAYMKLTDVRQERGISQEKLAKLSGVPQCRISRVESGLSMPKWDFVAKVSRALEVDPFILFPDVIVGESNGPIATVEGHD
jgi:transcriptional regulator with XRE-family HTH domain